MRMLGHSDLRIPHNDIYASIVDAGIRVKDVPNVDTQ